MLYFKNSELAYTYHVSVRTVRNWIEAAKQGKLDLDLHSQGNKTYVSNTSRNLSTIEQLVERGKKYRPHRAVKTVTPKPEFYQLFNDAQIYDIIKNLEIRHEIPREYNYFDGGANNWDNYAQRMALEEGPNLLNSTVKLLEINKEYLDNLIQSYKRVNIIDIGVGNAYPVKELLTSFIAQGKLGRYIALDISSEMLQIAKSNIRKWFGNKVAFEGYEVDINHERFTNYLAEDYIQDTLGESVNLVLFIGGTIQNLRKPDNALTVIHDSMNKNDLFIHTQKLDTVGSRKYFDFGVEPGSNTLAANHRFIFDLLNIDSSFYDVEMGYDDSSRQRYIRINLNIALTVNFQFAEGEHSISFSKGESILLWRYWHQSAQDIATRFDENEFSLLQSSQTLDEEYILTISRIKRD